MQVVSPDLIKDEKVLLRMDIDVPIKNGVVIEDFRLEVAIPTLHLCLEFAESVTIMGHIGRPNGKEVPELSVEPIYDWLTNRSFGRDLENGRLKLLENLRFEKGEDAADIDYAKELAQMGDFFVNEAFASDHQAASTTVLPTLLPHAAGLRFAKEVHVLMSVRENPKRPLVVIIGGAKFEDKYPAILALSKISDKVLVGGLLPEKIKQQSLAVPDNVILAEIANSGVDISEDSINKFLEIIQSAKQVIWAGPLGKYEDIQGNIADEKIARAVIQTGVDSVVGGGDTLTALDKYLPEFSFVSTGGGAMLKLLSTGTLPTIEALR